MKIQPLDAASAPAWEAFVASRPEATFFHRAAWASVLARAFGHAPHYLMAMQDGAVAGVLPLMQVRSLLFGHTLISTPFCVYGGPLAVDPAAYAALLQAAAGLLARSGASALELRLLDPPPQGGLDSGWVARADLYATFRRAISANDDDNLKAIPRKQRAVVRKALSGTLRAIVGQDVDGLHRVYSESVRNLGTPVFPRRYFRLLAEAFPDCMDVLAAVEGDTVHSAVMNFYWRDQVLPYYGGGTHAARASHAHDFMYWEVMRRAAAERGARLFDFGRSKAGTGAYAFKKNWGFTPTPLPQYFRLRPGAAMPDHNPLNPKYRLFIAGWKRLPLPIANLIGPYVVRGAG